MFLNAKVYHYSRIKNLVHIGVKFQYEFSKNKRKITLEINKKKEIANTGGSTPSNFDSSFLLNSAIAFFPFYSPPFTWNNKIFKRLGLGFGIKL